MENFKEIFLNLREYWQVENGPLPSPAVLGIVIVHEGKPRQLQNVLAPLQ